ncbi:hypothetical protein DsansV1_C09g0087321 [Dioscorea sansibarensis]
MITYPDEPVLRFKLLCSLYGVINKTKTTGLPTSELSRKLKNKDGVHILHLVHLRKLLLQLRLKNHQNRRFHIKRLPKPTRSHNLATYLGNNGSSGMQDINDLKPREQISNSITREA